MRHRNHIALWASICVTYAAIGAFVGFCFLYGLERVGL